MRYVRVVNGRVTEVIAPMYDDDNNFIPVELRYTQEFVESLVESSNESVVEGYLYDNGVFSLPKPYEPSPEEILSQNKQQQSYLLSQASKKLAPLQYAVDLDIATDKELAQLTSWKRYSVFVNRVDLTVLLPEWPTPPKD